MGSVFVAQPNTLNNYSVAADRVVVATELDKFSRNMNDPVEHVRDGPRALARTDRSAFRREIFCTMTPCRSSSYTPSP